MVANGTTPTITEALAERVKRHLTEEERTLIAVLESVRDLHQSLRQLDGEALTLALQNETAALREAEGLQRQRLAFRTETAGAFGLSPHEVTLSALATKTSGALQASVVETRQKLADMSEEMDRLNRQNAAMIQQSLLLMRGIVGHLTGTTFSGESYNAGGAREEAHVGPLVQWGG
ncbi:MAG: flagellar export chaperone FlgN [Planctomycetes bacterium]|nr:flagellar export chaperone FlgN [Planctomycetota bacterium]